MLAAFAAACVVNMNDKWGPIAVPAKGSALAEGRWAWAKEGGTFQWPAAGLLLRYRGSGVRLTFHDESAGGEAPAGGSDTNHLWTRTNGGEWRLVVLKKGENSLEFHSEDAKRPTTLEVRKRTESSVGPIRWTGLGLGQGTELLPAPERRPVLEVYGDSNSCGYGVEAPNRDTNYSPANSNALLSFSWVAAEAAGMELHLTSASGWGITRGYGGEAEASVPRVFDRVLINDEGSVAPAEHQPRVQVVVLGDNDFAQGDPGPEFDAAYLAFVRRLRARAPGSHIVMCVSAAMTGERKKRVGGAIDLARAALGTRAHRFDFPAYQEDWGWGADWHFSRAGQQALGAALAKAIAGLTG